MNVLLGLIEVISTFAEEMWMIYLPLVCSRRNDSGINRRIFWGVTAAGSMLTLCLNQIRQTSALTGMIAMIYALICVTWIWKINIIEAISCIGAYILFLLLSGIADIIVVGWIGGEPLIKACMQGDGISRLLYLCICGTFWNGVVLCSVRWLKKQSWNMNNRKAALFSAIGVIGFSLIFEQILSAFNENIGWKSIVLLLFTIFLIFLYYYHEKRNAWQKEAEQFEKDNARLEEMYQNIQNYYEDNAKIYHDMKNHLIVLRDLNQNEKREEIGKYLDSIVEEQTKYRKHIWTGIDIIDIVISEKQMLGEKRGITLYTEIDMLPASFPLPGRECCCLFANLLDNAIESARSTVYLGVKLAQQNYIISVRNDLMEGMEKGKSRPLSKKKDGLHGYGLKNVETIVGKHGGHISYEYDEKQFKVMLCLPGEMARNR